MFSHYCVCVLKLPLFGMKMVELNYIEYCYNDIFTDSITSDFKTFYKLYHKQQYVAHNIDYDKLYTLLCWFLV